MITSKRTFKTTDVEVEVNTVTNTGKFIARGLANPPSGAEVQGTFKIEGFKVGSFSIEPSGTVLNVITKNFGLTVE
ncbi:hypothetical protein [Acinetobacter bereziniae]|uniref:Uncharacterized protein n=1 Tax=Acinetobacter bereziniae NIPH 3 TaxID=1217651 RepID=N8YMZ7_ACIBZ|nr:hypothetical protein [Acinetobacter bereziniae]ENV20943.1 hypothetical protein F963_03074 [Acinetobacter bereziniae NIPH 3]